MIQMRSIDQGSAKIQQSENSQERPGITGGVSVDGQDDDEMMR